MNKLRHKITLNISSSSVSSERIPHRTWGKKQPTIKHKGIHLRKCSNIYRFMQMRLHMCSVHLLTCTRRRLQTDLLRTHKRGWGWWAGERVRDRGEWIVGGGGGGYGGCSLLLSTQHTEELQPADACCSLPPTATADECWKSLICSSS